MKLRAYCQDLKFTTTELAAIPEQLDLDFKALNWAAENAQIKLLSALLTNPTLCQEAADKNNHEALKLSVTDQQHNIEVGALQKTIISLLNMAAPLTETDEYDSSSSVAHATSPKAQAFIQSDLNLAIKPLLHQAKIFSTQDDFEDKARAHLHNLTQLSTAQINRLLDLTGVDHFKQFISDGGIDPLSLLSVKAILLFSTTAKKFGYSSKAKGSIR
jgi:hypothetical protein